MIRSNADKTLLSDGVDTVEVLITPTSLQEDLEQCLVEVTRPILCSEKYPQPNSYLIIKNIKRLANADISDDISNLCKTLTSATVLPPSPLTSSLEFKILCKSMIFNQRKGSYFLLQVSSEEGMILVKMTNLMFYKRCQVNGALTILSDEPFKVLITKSYQKKGRWNMYYVLYNNVYWLMLRILLFWCRSTLKKKDPDPGPEHFLRGVY